MSDWHPEDIKAEIRKAGRTLASIAASQDVSPQALSAAITARTSERLEIAIAECLGKRPHEIWPSRYRKNGERLRFCAPRKAEQVAA